MQAGKSSPSVLGENREEAPVTGFYVGGPNRYQTHPGRSRDLGFAETTNDTASKRVYGGRRW